MIRSRILKRNKRPNTLEPVKRHRFRPKPIPRTVVPSFFTLMNGLCGFLAIVQVFEGELVYGAWLILMAGLFDAIDGLMARLAKATSDFGVELDSLNDMVSFGVAPGFLMYVFLLHELNTVGMLLSALPVVCGAVRLARFNVMTFGAGDSDEFKGLPIPAQAGMLMAFFLIFRDNLEVFSMFDQGVYAIIIPLMILLSLLMVSTVPFDKVPRFTKPYLQKHPRRVLLFAIYGLVILIFREYGFVAVFSFFIAKGLVQAVARIIAVIREGGENVSDVEEGVF